MTKATNNTSSYGSFGGVGAETNIAKRQTQGIAAIAAQRKAYQHHRELMQELGQDSGSGNGNLLALTESRLGKHDLAGQYEDLFEKKSSAVTDNSGATSKAKKQVKIRDIVQYKLPEEEPVSALVGSIGFVKFYISSESEMKTLGAIYI